VTLPSVMVPSTSMSTTLICAARFLSAEEIFDERGKLTSSGKMSR
jgi:hypothetical protein